VNELTCADVTATIFQAMMGVPGRVIPSYTDLKIGNR